MRDRVGRVLCVVRGLALVAGGVGKLTDLGVSRWSPSLPFGAAMGVVGVELVVGLGHMFMPTSAAFRQAAVLLFACFAVYHLVSVVSGAGHAPCGCLGERWRLSHSSLAVATGLLLATTLVPVGGGGNAGEAAKR